MCAGGWSEAFTQMTSISIEVNAITWYALKSRSVQQILNCLLGVLAQIYAALPSLRRNAAAAAANLMPSTKAWRDLHHWNYPSNSSFAPSSMYVRSTSKINFKYYLLKFKEPLPICQFSRSSMQFMRIVSDSRRDDVTLRIIFHRMWQFST